MSKLTFGCGKLPNLMDVEYAWILGHDKNCRQFCFPFPLSFYVWVVYPVGGVGMG